MKPFVCLCALLLSLTFAPESASRENRPHARVLLIPLDDRPPCLQFVIMQGRIADAEVVAPPRELLGRFTEPGQPEKIAAWVRAQDLRAFDAAVISVDMLAYGGLVASRVHRVSLETARRRLELVREIRRRAPQLPLYGFNVIMRLAPTADGRNEAYREKLARWAELSSEAARNAKVAAEVERLEREIPKEALEDYKQARRRNFEINRASIALVKDGVFEFLILSQDDAKPRGVHIADRENLIAEAQRLDLADRVRIQPGADEVAMLLLSRALARRFDYEPRVHAIYSSEEKRRRVAPYEDRPLEVTVSFQIAAAGAREVARPEDADLLFYVYASRDERGAARAFAERIAQDVARGRRVIVADVDFGGVVQGAGEEFTEELRRRGVFPRLFGYASWNTAGNTIGTALPQGILFALAVDRLASDPAAAERIAGAQMKFLLHRLIDDYAYHSLVRVEINRRFAPARGLNTMRLDAQGTRIIEEIVREKMRPYVESLWRDFAQRPFVLPPASGVKLALVPTALEDFKLTLPWGRTFEAEIDFRLVAAKQTVTGD
ncbi:MAG: hypothetical protein C4334_01665 [Pyrinomonas sp.]|uniref:DUF4127 family protein n=1 Tax=Pyrinomonas sp. TaxID=2080306 RepID=UPI003326E526